MKNIELNISHLIKLIHQCRYNIENVRVHHVGAPNAHLVLTIKDRGFLWLKNKAVQQIKWHGCITDPEKKKTVEVVNNEALQKRITDYAENGASFLMKHLNIVEKGIIALLAAGISLFYKAILHGMHLN